MTIKSLDGEFFFQPEHYETFLPEKIHLNNREILKERKNVQSKLYELHDEIFPIIKKSMWEIDKHNFPAHILSSINIDNPLVANKVSSIWLHYGKTNKELREYKKISTDKENITFINHIRLQIIIFNNARTKTSGYGIGTWLVVGKNDGSIWDRNFIQERIRKDADFVTSFFKIVKSLGDDYIININSKHRKCNEFISESDFLKYIKEDNINEYFIIGKDFLPTDVGLKKEKITDTIFLEFTKLYPLYNLLKHKL